MQPSDSRPPVGRGSGRPWPVAYPVPRATRRKKGLPGAWAVLFQRAVGSDPAGCASRRAHRVETAIAFRLHNALGTQNERYFVAVNPTAHSLACLRIGVFVTADAARLATGVGGALHRTGFAPVGRRTKFHDVTASSLPFDQPCLVAPCTNAPLRRNDDLRTTRARRLVDRDRVVGGIRCDERSPSTTGIRSTAVMASSTGASVRACATITPDRSTPRWSFFHPRLPCPPCFETAHAPWPTIDRPVLSTMRWMGPVAGIQRSITAIC